MSLGRVRTLALLALVVTLGLGAACSDSPTSPSGITTLGVTDIRSGTGAEAANGNVLTVHYTLWLYDPDRAEQKGIMIESSTSGAPFTFTLGAGQVITGWDVGLKGAKAGALRRLVVPPSQAYGDTRHNTIPPFSTLVFEIELVSIAAGS